MEISYGNGSMLGLQLLLTIALLAVCGFAPGFFVVRRLRWNPLEKLCGAVGLSLILIYLFHWGLYCLQAGRGDAPDLWPCAIYSVVAVGLGAAAWRDAFRLFRACRRAALAFAALAAWTLGLLSLIRVYSGGAWYGDWLEHFQRTLYFLHHFSSSTPIMMGYTLPARPPMMNVVAAFFLSQTADRFELFQAVFALLNVLVFLPCCLIMPALGGRRRTWLLAALFAASPVIMQASTYTWTKSLAAFYVVLAIWFYLAGWRKRDSVRMTAAFVALSAGVLVHYSAGPYVVFLGAHYVAVVLRTGRRKLAEPAAIAACCGLLLATWFGWSLRQYGARGTFASNTSVTSSRQYQGSNVVKIGANLWDSIVPAIVRDPALFNAFQQEDGAGKIRDEAFLTYQTNAIFGMGIVGGPLVLWLLYSVSRRPDGRERRFWIWFVPVCVLLGIASVGERDPLGVAHLTLLSLMALGLAFLAGRPMRRGIVTALAIGCALDLLLGVGLQIAIEQRERLPAGSEFSAAGLRPADVRMGGLASLSQSAQANWFRKHQFALCSEWVSQLRKVTGVSPEMIKPYQDCTAEDGPQWHGWLSRHGGSVDFLGDAVAWAQPALWLCALAGGAAWLLVIWRRARPMPVAVAAPVPAARTGSRRKKVGERR
jgi:hypothetical protein